MTELATEKETLIDEKYERERKRERAKERNGISKSYRTLHMWSHPHTKQTSVSKSHKAATHNACALVRAMASTVREANTDDERALYTAAAMKDAKTLTSLLEKGVCPNICDVC